MYSIYRYKTDLFHFDLVGLVSGGTSSLVLGIRTSDRMHHSDNNTPDASRLLGLERLDTQSHRTSGLVFIVRVDFCETVM